MTGRPDFDRLPEITEDELTALIVQAVNQALSYIEEGIVPGSRTSFPVAAKRAVDLPPGWLICDGSAVSRTEFRRLFEVIEDNYGVGDGSTTFNLPTVASTVDFDEIIKT